LTLDPGWKNLDPGWKIWIRDRNIPVLQIKTNLKYFFHFPRLVRFDNLLGRVPHRQSLGFGGQAGGVGFGGGQAGGVPDHDYDRGLVQKLILVLLKCVALTTREARYGTGI
jgi:hypothetical protein